MSDRSNGGKKEKKTSTIQYNANFEAYNIIL